MTRADQKNIDASTAAALVKQTAEATATSLNIQYIQKDILEIKQAVKDLSSRDEHYVTRADFDKALLDHEDRLRAVEKNLTIVMTWGAAFVILLTIAEFIVGHLWK